MSAAPNDCGFNGQINHLSPLWAFSKHQLKYTNTQIQIAQNSWCIFHVYAILSSHDTYNLENQYKYVATNQLNNII